jgi:hypothetical protein
MNASKKKLTAWVVGAVLGFVLFGACGAPTTPPPAMMGGHTHGDAVVAASDR